MSKSKSLANDTVFKWTAPTAFLPYYMIQWNELEGKGLHVKANPHNRKNKNNQFIEQEKKRNNLQIIDDMALINRTELLPDIIITFATLEYGGTTHTGVSIKSPKDVYDKPSIGVRRALLRMYRAITKNKEFVIPQQRWLDREEIVVAGRALLNQKLDKNK